MTTGGWIVVIFIVAVLVFLVGAFLAGAEGGRSWHPDDDGFNEEDDR